MRIIKFRGKSSRKDKDMWLYGDLIKIGDNYHILEKDDIIEDGHHITQDSDRPTWVEEETIGQFTGLHDKNGKEIYEGDVIQGEYDYKHLIRYDEQRAQFTATLLEHVGDKIFDKSNAGNVYQQWIDEFKKAVVGNIHDNPELLEGGGK